MRGKKSIPARGADEQAVTRTTVSPCVTVTAALAKRAILPVSIVIGRLSPRSTVTDPILDMYILVLCSNERVCFCLTGLLNLLEKTPFGNALQETQNIRNINVSKFRSSFRAKCSAVGAKKKA